MDETVRKRETRKQKRLDRLETNNPVCCICGEPDSRCLEKHHVAGRQFDELEVVICRNDHRKLSDDQRDHPTKIETKQPSLHERLAHFLSGLADFLILLAERLRQFSKELITFALVAAQTEESRA
jgi:hypothetical protein